MYYLLEDNRIIDSEDIRHFEEDGYLKTLDTFFEEIKIIGKIKKQSENVYDLIEVGDLVTEKRKWCGEDVYVTANVWSKEDKLIHCFHFILFEHNVYAIYKQDAKGNYIKVWEVKEDERKTSSKTD